MDAQGNRVFAVDFDGTLSLGKWPETGEPNEELFSFLIKEKEKGSRIILYTCRNGEQLSEAVRYCNHYGLKFDEVNRNLQEYIEFYGGDTRKINADYYIDDKAIDPGSLIEKIKAGQYKEREDQTMFGKKKDSRRELREVFRATEEIQDAESPRDADMATGYVIGIIDEKVRDGRLSIATAEALGKMVEAVGENIYRQLSRGAERGSIAKIYSIEDPEESEDPGTGV